MGKNSSNDLFHLIKSLSSSEKVYFKTSVLRKTKSDQLFVLIFDLIDCQSVYNEKKILDKLQQLNISRRALFNSKHYLIQQILNSLDFFHSKSSVGFQVSQLIRFSENLYNKGLYSFANKKIKKAKQLAYKYECFPMLFEVLSVERKIMRFLLNINGYEQGMLKNYKERIAIEKIYINERKYSEFAAQISILSRKSGHARTSEEKKKMLRIFNNPLFKSENNALSFNALISYCNVKVIYYYFTNDSGKALDYAKKLVEAFHRQPYWIDEKQSIYMGALNNLLASQYEAELYLVKDFWNTLEKLKAIVPQSEHIRIQKLIVLFTFELHVYTKVAEFDRARTTLYDITTEFEKYKNSISDSDKIWFYYNALYISFCIGEYSNALKWTNELLNLQSIGSRADYIYYAKLINVLTHYELGNYETVSSLLDSLYRFTNKKNRFYGFEKIVYQNMKEIIRKDNRKEIFLEFKNELINLSKKDRYEQTPLKAFDLLGWIDAKIQGKDFAEIIRETFILTKKKEGIKKAKK